MVGLWSMQQRDVTDPEEQARMDLHYIDSWSIWLDLAILLKALIVLPFRRRPPSGEHAATDNAG
jgi:lipopolysaccharide/colanic/teichoic acid biosynthesis glycosyltransferase